jgi:hypothetical protein
MTELETGILAIGLYDVLADLIIVNSLWGDLVAKPSLYELRREPSSGVKIE